MKPHILTSAFLTAITLTLLLLFATPKTAEAQIYFSAEEEIFVIQSGDVEPEFLLEGDAFSLAADIDGGFIYWTEPSASGTAIKRAELDGSNTEVLIDEDAAMRGLALDLVNGKMYWADLRNNGAILRAELDGSNMETLIAGDEDGITDGVLDVALDLENDHLYWVKTGAIMRSGLDGNDPEVLVEIAAFIQPSAIEVNSRDGFVYWVDTGGENIMRADMENGVAEVLISADEPYGLSVDVKNDRLFWMSQFFFAGNGRVSTANLDGTGREIITDVGATRGAVFGAGWELATSGESFAEKPSAVLLNQNYPNPFNPLTVIEYHLTETAEVSLTVYNSVGQQVAILAENTLQNSGIQRVEFDASSLPSGVYMYRLRAGEVSLMRKMTLLK